MPRQFLAALCGACAFLFQGCMSIPADRITPGSSMITTGGATAGKWQEIPMTAVELKDPIYFVTYAQWTPVTDSAGRHDITWLWYSGDRLVETRKVTLELKVTPFRLWARTQAAALGVGHFRAVVQIDGRDFATKEFDVVEVKSERRDSSNDGYAVKSSAAAFASSGTLEGIRTHCSNALQAAKDVGFPAAAANRGVVDGTVTMAMVLAPDGAIKDVAVVKSSDPVFNQAAIDTVMRLRCKGSTSGENLELRWVMDYRAQ